MTAAVVIALVGIVASWLVGLAFPRVTRRPKMERRRSRRPIRGDFWLWEQETRRNDR